MKVIAYKSTLPRKIAVSPSKDNHKVQTLTNFITGVNACGDEGILWTDMSTQPCDVAMMLGWVHENGKQAPHLSLRQKVSEFQTSKNKRTVIADSNLFLYKDTKNPYNYLRYSFDGVFPDSGEYCDQNPDPARWEVIKNQLNLSIKDWRTSGDHILICLQRNGGWSMGPHSVDSWAANTIKKIRQYSDRPIRLRSHPGDKNALNYVHKIVSYCNLNGWNNVSISEKDMPFTRDLKHCWAVVNHNSSPAIGAAIEGIPVFVTDPGKSQAKDVANTSFSRIESPKLFENRQQWLERMSQFHWSNEDLISGRCWAHMRNWAKK